MNIINFGILLPIFLLFPKIAYAQTISDAELREEMIAASISSYPSICPCPYSSNETRICGGNSAYNRPNGEKPLCYPSDITDEMIENYKKVNK